jgi:hypothetical protein
MRGNTKLVVALTVVTIIAAAVASVAAIAGRSGTGAAVLARISSDGTPVPRASISAEQVRVLGLGGIDPTSIRVLTSRNDITFYTAAASETSEQCFISGSPGAAGFSLGITICRQPGQPAMFPSIENAILDLSPQIRGLTDDVGRVQRLVGFADDRVERVGIVDAAGNVLYATPVVSNTYASDGVVPEGVAIVALGSDGSVLSSKSLRVGP